MHQYEFQTVIYQEGKHYVAQCLDVDVSSFGDNEKEALENLKEALELYLDDTKNKSLTIIKNPAVRKLHLEHA